MPTRPTEEELEQARNETHIRRVKEGLRELNYFTEKEIDKICSSGSVLGMNKAAFDIDTPFYNCKNKVNEFVNHFSKHGLLKSDFLECCKIQPALIFRNPKNLIDKIEVVTNYFKDSGLTKSKFLEASLNQPSIFSSSSKRVIGNINTVVNEFERDGLKLKDYISAALNQPQLFCHSPETISGHLHLYKKLFEQKKIKAHYQLYDDQKEQPFKPLLQQLLKRPTFLCLSNENIQLRDFYVALFPEHKGKANPVYRSRKQISSEIEKRLGHKDSSEPIPKIYDLEELAEGLLPEVEAEKQAHNLLHRGMVRANLLSGELEDDSKSTTKFQDKVTHQSNERDDEIER